MNGDFLCGCFHLVWSVSLAFVAQLGRLLQTGLAPASIYLFIFSPSGIALEAGLVRYFRQLPFIPIFCRIGNKQKPAAISDDGPSVITMTKKVNPALPLAPALSLLDCFMWTGRDSNPDGMRTITIFLPYRQTKSC
jgi:hypothetical protein